MLKEKQTKISTEKIMIYVRFFSGYSIWNVFMENGLSVKDSML